MSTQARMSQSDPRLYNPGRDLAHNFDHVVMAVAEQCISGYWPELADYMAAAGATQSDIGRAVDALCVFVSTPPTPGETMQSCIAACGFLDQKPAVQIAIMAYMGRVVTGMYFVGVREATLGGKGPALTYQQLRDAGSLCARLMDMGPVRRWWERLKIAASRAWRAFREPMHNLDEKKAVQIVMRQALDEAERLRAENRELRRAEKDRQRAAAAAQEPPAPGVV